MATRCLFVSDLHGHTDRYEKLFGILERERPALVLLGGDLFPSHAPVRPGSGGSEFVGEVLEGGFSRLRARLGDGYPQVALILGNDDPRSEEEEVIARGTGGLWHYLHMGRLAVGSHVIYGYACVPPTPFRLKDWERYDVSRYVDPGCTHPTEGFRTVPVEEHVIRHATIKNDLEQLAGAGDMERAVFLFHAPPHDTLLDRAALDGVMVEHAPLDVHIGSVAIRRFIGARQPLVTLHGHVHESARLTGAWKETIGRTVMLSAAHDGPELCVVRFTLERPADAERELV